MASRCKVHLARAQQAQILSSPAGCARVMCWPRISIDLTGKIYVDSFSGPAIEGVGALRRPCSLGNGITQEDCRALETSPGEGLAHHGTSRLVTASGGEVPLNAPARMARASNALDALGAPTSTPEKGLEE